jgi:hypothetical protein
MCKQKLFFKKKNKITKIFKNLKVIFVEKNTEQEV